MSVLVAYASRHGSTKAIAERIAARLTSKGVPAEAFPAAEVRHPETYDGFVVGSALYMFKWLGDAEKFVNRHGSTLRGKPVWLFSSGPIGPDKPNDKGVDPRDAAGPRNIPQLMTSTRAREHKVLFGAWDASAKSIGLAERFMKLMPAARNAMPSGDFRDWPAIDAWADQIAAALTRKA